MTAIKNDLGKPDLSLIPLPAMEALAYSLMYGEKKYSRNNFRAGFDTNRLVASSLRHIYQWQNGEDLDSESGVSHLGHALASLTMLVTNLAEGVATDGRYHVQGGYLNQAEISGIRLQKQEDLGEARPTEEEWTNLMSSPYCPESFLDSEEQNPADSRLVGFTVRKQKTTH